MPQIPHVPDRAAEADAQQPWPLPKTHRRPTGDPHAASPADATRHRPAHRGSRPPGTQLILAGHGSDGQRRLAAGRVLVVGADEINAPLIAHLADSGVGMIGVADGSPMDPWDRYLGLPDADPADPADPADRATAWARALGRTHPVVRAVAERAGSSRPARANWSGTTTSWSARGRTRPAASWSTMSAPRGGHSLRVELHGGRLRARREPFLGLLSPEATEAARASTISVEQLKELLDADEPVHLVDVREPDEYAFAHLPGSVPVPQGEFLNGDAAARLPTDRRTVLLCRAGIRSAEVLAGGQAQRSPGRGPPGRGHSVLGGADQPGDAHHLLRHSPAPEAGDPLATDVAAPGGRAHLKPVSPCNS